MDANKKILVVEDDRQLRDVISKKLSAKGIAYVAAASIQEAEAALAEGDFDAVWLDHYLGGKDMGLDLLKKMRKKAETKGIPVFLVSHTATEDKLDEYRRLGIADYFYKLTADLGDIVDAVASRIV